MFGTRFRPRDAALIAVMLVLAAAYLWAASGLRVPKFGGPVNARIFPYILGVGLILTALGTWFERRKPAEATAESFTRGELLRSAGVVAWTVLYAFVMAPLGFIVATALYLAGLGLVYHTGRRSVAVATAIGVSLALYALMDLALGLPLPNGLLPF